MLKKINRQVAFASVVGVLASASPAFALGTADTAVTTAMTTLTDNIVATLAAVAPIVVGIAGVLLGWKYGRRIFNMIAK